MSPTSLPWLITIVGLLIVASAFVFVLMGSQTKDDDYNGVMRRAYAIRKGFFIVFIVSGIVITALTLRDLPYDAHATVMDDAVKVNVTGHQWYWDIKQTDFVVGQPVIFNVTSADVNHGFGIYDDQLRLLNQTQAMPGYINKLVHVFEQPGKYKILCLEYCGLSHHSMVAELTVTQ